MEGVGARLGRSSTRYGPATVFTGPVRKWKKKWVHVAPSNAASHHHSQSHSHNHNNNNATINGNNGSHLLFYKWTPITQSNNGNNLTDDKNSGKDEPVLEEPPRRKFKYIPVAVLEEQQHEAAEKVEDEGKLLETESRAGGGSTSKVELLDEKPDINDVPMEESQEKIHQVRQDLNESTLDLSLNLNACDDDVESGSNTDQ